jgi:hypothetical protein
MSEKMERNWNTYVLLEGIYNGKQLGYASKNKVRHRTT